CSRSTAWSWAWRCCGGSRQPPDVRAALARGRPLHVLDPSKRAPAGAVGVFPELVVAGPDVPPKDVGLAIAGIVRDAHHLPPQVASLGQGHRGCLPRPPPVLDLAVEGVPPQQVTAAVAIEVGYAGDLPRIVRNRRQRLLRVVAGTWPDGVPPVVPVAPEDVIATIPVEIRNPRDPPVQVG